MATQSGWVRAERAGDGLLLAAGGSWVIATLGDLDARLREVADGSMRSARIDLGAVEHLDTAGAWVLYRTREQLRARGIDAEFDHAKAAHAELLQRIQQSHIEQDLVRSETNPLTAMVERVGRATLEALREGAELISFLGVTTLTFVRSLSRPSRIRLTALIVHIERVGLDAMPIVGLLAFLIGVVIAYQGADQLARFGASIFAVNLLGVSVLREMGVLLTAIILAGRSGSAFTAQIGTMQVNEEVDAMRTIGLDPIELLVLPRVLGLMIAMPLLTVYADLMGLLGGAAMSFAVLEISFDQFLERLRSAVPLSWFWVGMVKAPVFGFVVGLVGCHQGLKVRGSAESVGENTTRSVAISIFLVILIDALFSIFFSIIKV